MAGALDVPYLLDVAKDPETSRREDLAEQLAWFIADDKTRPEDRAAVTPVLLKLADDSVTTVRLKLARAIAASRHAPREVLRTLVCDIDEICVPLLEVTPAMPDSDLAAVAKAGPATRQMAIARRCRIGPQLARIVVEVSSPVVCARLLRNPGCAIDKTTYERIVERHGADPAVAAAIRKRRDLPVHIAALLIEETDDSDLVVDLVANGAARGRRGGLVAADQRETGIIRLAAEATGAALDDLIGQLFRSNSLTASLVLRAAFVGNMDFVNRALAHLSGVPLKRVQSLLHGKARLGSRAIYLRAGLPADGYRGFRMALDVFQELRVGDVITDRPAFGRRMVERVITGYDDFTPAEQKMLLDMLVRLGTEDTRTLAGQIADRLSMVVAA